MLLKKLFFSCVFEEKWLFLRMIYGLTAKKTNSV